MIHKSEWMTLKWLFLTSLNSDKHNLTHKRGSNHYYGEILSNKYFSVLNAIVSTKRAVLEVVTLRKNTPAPLLGTEPRQSSPQPVFSYCHDNTNNNNNNNNNSLITVIRIIVTTTVICPTLQDATCALLWYVSTYWDTFYLIFCTILLLTDEHNYQELVIKVPVFWIISYMYVYQRKMDRVKNGCIPYCITRHFVILQLSWYC
jgi:hypothetical protein